MADTMKFLWGANSKIPARSNDTNGKAYFAIIDNGYTDTAAPGNEAFIYLDKAGARYNVIAKRAIFDSLGYKITDKYFSFARNNEANLLQFYTPSQNPNASTTVAIGSAPVITSIQVSQDIDAEYYNLTTTINGFTDSREGDNSDLELQMATEETAGLMSAGEQIFGGSKHFLNCDYFEVATEDSIYLSTANVIDLSSGSEAYFYGSDYISLSSDGQVVLYSSSEISIEASTNLDITATEIDITGTTAIAGNTSIIGTFGATGKVVFTNETQASASDGAVKVTGGVSIGKKLYTTGVATFATTTDATSTSSGSVIVKGGIGIAKSAYIGYGLNVGRSVNLNGTSVTEDYSTNVYGPFRAYNSAKMDRNVVLNSEEPTADTYTTLVKGKATFNKDVSLLGQLNVGSNVIIGGDLAVRGGDIYLGAAGDYATITYSSGTVTISFPS